MSTQSTGALTSWSPQTALGAGGTGEVEARFARKHLDSDHLGISLFRYGSGYRSRTGHSHREQEEVYVVVGGSGRVKLGDEVLELRPWDAVRVAPSTVRASVCSI